MALILDAKTQDIHKENAIKTVSNIAISVDLNCLN